MSSTSKGKRWELAHSLWIGWTFTLFLYPVAFLYTGFRTSQKKWIAWGAAYSTLFVFFIIFLEPNPPYSWWSNVTGLSWLLLWPVSVFHAFKIRKEYLFRLEISQRQKGRRETVLKRQIESDANLKEIPTMQKARTPNIVDQTLPRHVADDNGLSYEDLLKVCYKYAGDGCYVGEAIPPKKLTNARSCFPIPDSEHVATLVDTSVFGSNKTGLAICGSGIYWRNDWATETKETFLAWGVFTSVSIVGKGGISPTVELGDGNIVMLSSGTSFKKDQAVRMLSELQIVAKAGFESSQSELLEQETNIPEKAGSKHTEQSKSEKQVAPDRKPTRSAPSAKRGSSTSDVDSILKETSISPSKVEQVRHEILSGDEIEYRISSSYPFPIAFGFRSLMSIVDPRDLYREQLRVAENMLAFLGSISLALVHEQDREKVGIDPKEFWTTGISPGDWKEIVGRCSKVFASYEDDPLALAIRGTNIRSEKKERSFGANITALIRAKNDFKHDRGPVVLEEIAEASMEVQDRLRRCMEILAFSTAYPIRQVGDFDVARRGSGVILKCLRYMGDHPSFPQEEVPFHQALPRGDLFLDLGQRGWAPLFPFITTRTCSHCKARETYFIDAWDTRRATARMKSFERGHTMNSAEVSEALAEGETNARSSTS